MKVQDTKKQTVIVIELKRSAIMKEDERSQKKVVAYCRTSKDNESKNTSCAEMGKLFTEIFVNRSNLQFAGLYSDERISALKSDNRPEYLHMIKDCYDGKIDYIITPSLSHLSRNIADGIEFLRRLKAHGIDAVIEEVEVEPQPADNTVNKPTTDDGLSEI